MLSVLFFSALGMAALPSGYHPVIISGPFMGQGLKLKNWDNVNKVSVPDPNIHVRPFGYAGSTKDQLDGLTTFGGGKTDEYPLVVRMRSIGYEINDSFFGHTFDW